MECNLCDFIFEVQITWGHTEQFQHFRNCLYSDLQTTSRETYHRSWLCHIWEPPVSSPSRLVLVSVPGFMTFVTYFSHFSYLRTYHPHQDCSQSLCPTNIPVGLNWIFWDISPQEQVRDWIGWEGIYWGGYLSAQIFFCTNIYLHNIHLNHICLQKYLSAKSEEKNIYLQSKASII